MSQKYMRTNLSQRALAWMATELEELTGITYFETGWSSPVAYLAAVMRTIEVWKRDAERYVVLKHHLDMVERLRKG